MVLGFGVAVAVSAFASGGTPSLWGLLAALAGPLSAVLVALRGAAPEAAAPSAESGLPVSRLGSFAAALAHEIKNPLTSVVLSLQLAESALAELRAQLPAGALEGLTRRLAGARDGADRVAVIVRELQALAGAELDAPEPLDVREVIESTLRLAQPQLRGRVRVHLESHGHCTVTAHRARLGQVLLNLVLNASQACGGRGEPGRIQVTVTSSDTDVVLEVQDDGPGMTPEVLRRAFEPYFTTKLAGEGTGLGLFISRKLIAGYGGHLEATSRPGEGACFRVRLPASPAAARMQPSSHQIVLRDSLFPDPPSSLRPTPGL